MAGRFANSIQDGVWDEQSTPEQRLEVVTQIENWRRQPGGLPSPDLTLMLIQQFLTPCPELVAEPSQKLLVMFDCFQ